MARITAWRIMLGLTASGLLTACVETSGKGDAQDAAAVPAATERLRPGTEVEAPEVFQANESALWDGRPSLGGIWVASPDVIDPERVVMFNPATGKSVKGALFRRERDNPGPRLQLSSDAAEALGVLAGMPTEIQVTALRKQEAAVPEEIPPSEEALAADPTAESGQETAATDAGEAEAVAAAALAAVDANGATAGKDGTATEPAEGEAVAADPADAAAVVEPPKKKTWKEKRAEAKAAREAKKAAAAAAKAAAAAGAVVAVDGSDTTSAPTADTAGVAEIESAPLDARKPEVAAGEVETSATPKTAEEPAAEPVEPAPAAASGTPRPIQIASFSKEENANRAVEALAKIGITAQPQKSEKDGKIVWGVVATGDDGMLTKIKDAGFADAYFLK